LELKVSLFVPPHNPATVLVSRLASALRERSGGRLSLAIHHSEALGNTAEHYDLARGGAADIAYMIHSATPGRFPLTELAHLPPVPGAAAATAALQALLPVYLAAEHAGVKVLFLAANTPMAIHSTVPLRALGELKGLRVGHTGRVVAATLRALGAVPVTVMPLQIRAALESGAIDATSMTYEAAWVTRLANVVRSTFELNANTITFGLVMNNERYRALAPELRAVVDDVLGARAAAELAGLLAEAAVEGKRYLAEAGVAINAPASSERGSLDALSANLRAEFVEELTSQGLPGRTVFDLLKGGSA
jgi:TRAP-type transport system periplasmic protein